MSQSKKHSHYEAATNQITGIIIGWCLVYFAFPIMGVVVSVEQATGSSFMFFIASYTRSYTIRRVFNKIGSKA
ncbi:DUF7220 family protein [Sulfurovum xiamenensis]|uniref:DUF7220 family protein n=1 Tax=Sulfurovum xiamenensis TaxID=3019066 RepID=UPI003DA3559F